MPTAGVVSPIKSKPLLAGESPKTIQEITTKTE
jgi:hypothetical protein